MIVKEQGFESVKDFLNALVIDGPTPGLDYTGFVFRGVSIGSGKKERQLIPSALRIDNFSKVMKLSGSSEGNGIKSILCQKFPS